MSVPATRVARPGRSVVARPIPERLPHTRPRPAPRPIRVPARPSPGPARRPGAQARARRLRFTVFAALLLASLVVALVSAHALLAQAAFRTADLNARIERIERENALLEVRIARLSAPGRLLAEARRLGLDLPDEVHVVTVRDPDRERR